MPRQDRVPPVDEEGADAGARVLGHGVLRRLREPGRAFGGGGPRAVPRNGGVAGDDRILRRDGATGTVGVFRTPAGHSDGDTVDRQGRPVACEQGDRRVARTEPDGTVTVLADRYDDKRLNSPNDSVVRSDGMIWFSDPDFGITSDYEGHRTEPGIGACNLYRSDPLSGDVHLAADGFEGPSGVVPSPDGSRLYVSGSRAARIHAYDIREDGPSALGEVFAEGRGGVRFDTIRFDDEGRLRAAALDDGVHRHDPDGTLIGKLLVPEPVPDSVFGGPKNNRLFIPAADLPVLPGDAGDRGSAPLNGRYGNPMRRTGIDGRRFGHSGPRTDPHRPRTGASPTPGHRAPARNPLRPKHLCSISLPASLSPVPSSSRHRPGREKCP